MPFLDAADGPGVIDGQVGNDIFSIGVAEIEMPIALWIRDADAFRVKAFLDSTGTDPFVQHEMSAADDFSPG